jgi:hypothetical protein
MRTLENLPLSTLLRFGLAGLVSIVLYVILPLGILRPDALLTLANTGGAIALLVGAVCAGFVLDSLKIYQFSLGYQRRKVRFMQQIAEALGVEESAAPFLFVKAAELERKFGLGYVDFMHSRYVMIDAFSKLFLVAAFLWGGVALIESSLGYPGAAIAFAISAGVCLLFGLRLVMTSRQEQRRAEHLYVDFCRRHCDDILGSDLVHRE